MEKTHLSSYLSSVPKDNNGPCLFPAKNVSIHSTSPVVEKTQTVEWENSQITFDDKTVKLN